MVTRQVTTAYTPVGGVCMVDETQQMEVIHTVPKMTETERQVTEKRISNDLYSVLSDIYDKLQSESE